MNFAARVWGSTAVHLRQTGFSEVANAIYDSQPKPQDKMSSFPFIFFMHIPKTAGVSFITMMKKLVGAEYVLSFAEQFMADADVLRRNAANKRLVTGHIFFHDWKHQMTGGRPCKTDSLAYTLDRSLQRPRV
jgi:hypothetical protein